MDAMDREGLREEVRAMRVAGRSRFEVRIEGEAQMTELAEPAERVLGCTGNLAVESARLEDGEAVLEGQVFFDLIVSGMHTHLPRALSVSAPFSHREKLSDRFEGGQLLTGGSIRETACELTADGDSIRFSASALMDIAVLLPETGRVLTAVGGEESAEEKRMKVASSFLLGQGTEQARLSDEVRLPGRSLPIDEVLRAKGTASVDRVSAGEGEAVLEGQMRVDVLYRPQDPEQPVQQMTLTLPYEAAVEIEESRTGAEAVGHVTVERVRIEPPAVSGEDFVQVEADMLLQAEVFEQRETEILQDAFIPGKETRVNKERIVLSELPVSREVSVTVRDEVPIDAALSGIERIGFVTAQGCPETVTVTEDGLRVEGTVQIQLALESGEDLQLYPDEVRLPFSELIPMEGRVTDDVRVQVTDVPVNASLLPSGQAAIEAQLQLLLEEYPATETEAVTEFEVGEAAFAGPCAILVVYIQKGDTMWEIARRYGVTLQSVRELNPQLEPDNLPIGAPLFLLRRCG